MLPKKIKVFVVSMLCFIFGMLVCAVIVVMFFGGITILQNKADAVIDFTGKQAGEIAGSMLTGLLLYIAAICIYIFGRKGEILENSNATLLTSFIAGLLTPCIKSVFVLYGVYSLYNSLTAEK